MGTSPPELLRMRQRLGHAPPRELTAGQLAGVLVAARSVGFAVEDHVECHAH